jgi:DNA polymerase III subunit delta
MGQQLHTEQVVAHLAKAQFSPLYLIHGDEPLLQIEAADLIRAAATKAGYSERDVWMIEQHFNWESATADSGNLSLFATKKITEIRVPSGKVGVEGGQHMAALARNANDDTILLASFPKLDRAQLSSAWFTAWSERGVVIEAKAVEREHMAAWLMQRLALQDQKADKEAMQFLVDHCEGNLVAAIQEVRKLALVCPKPTLTLADIEDAVADVARYTVPELCETFLRGDIARYATVLNGLREEGTATPILIWQLSDCVHALARAMMFFRGGGVAAAQALRQAQVWKNKEAIEAALGRVQPRAIAPCVHLLAELDAASKGLRPQLDVWATMVSLAQKLHGK